MSRKLKSVSPGEMLAMEFLKPLGMSNFRLAKVIGVLDRRSGSMLSSAEFTERARGGLAMHRLTVVESDFHLSTEIT